MLSAAGLGAIVFGVLQSSQWGWILPKAGVPVVNGVPLAPLGLSPTLWLIIIGALLLRWFARLEERVKARGDEPLLDLALLGIARMKAGLIVQWCQAFIIQATFFVLPLYLQIVLGFDALQTGKTILPMSVALFVFALGGASDDGALRSQAHRAARPRDCCWSARSCCSTSWGRTSPRGASPSAWL